MRVQFWHIVVLLLVVLLLFGANRLPDLARSVGKSMKIFKDEVKDLRDDSSRTPPAGPGEDPGDSPPPREQDGPQPPQDREDPAHSDRGSRDR